MKKFLFLLILSLTLCGLTNVYAQSGCGIYINSDFESECLLTDYNACGPYYLELESDDCILACKRGTVRYTAECDNASQYSWVISGASNYYLTNQGKTAVVTWGSGLTGNISVSVVVGDTNTCSAEMCILLMDSPDAESSSVPSFYYTQDGEKVIEICLGETIDFVDMSSAVRTPITGYYWESMFGASSTQNHSLTPLAEGEFELVHCVRNECGCEDCENYRIIVRAPVELELSCYGTVCENTTASYSVINPQCDRYMWNVEGGSLEGQGTPDITVHWGSPASGYGVISLDASMCETECNSLLSIQIPIIINNAEISGPETVCVGEMQIYELPRWGSTEYTWWNDNSSCLNVYDGGSPNQYMLEFTHTGPVTIGAKYICKFLNCGYFMAAQKTIIVKDTMSIHSDKDTYCKGDTGVFYTTHTNPVQWSVYNQNNQLIYSSNAVTLSYTFTSAGKFKITASHSDYCKVVEYHVTVLDNPPALTSTTGDHTACPGGSILLEATPTHPRYYLVWEPVCNPTSSEEGNEVTITFNNGVCDVAVYQVDNEYNCRSEAFIHEVDTFHLLPHGLPAITTTCAGSTVQFNVPDQSPNVTYEWTISPANAASIDSSDHLLPSVGILTNHLTNVTPPYLVDVKLKRTYCSGLQVYETVQILVEDVPKPILNCPDTVCEDELVTLTASGNTTVASHYQWSFSDTLQTFQGTSVSRRFHHSGYVYVTVTYQPNPDCDPAIVLDTIWVNSKPYADITQNGGNLQVQYYPNASYVWTYNGNVVSQTSVCSDMGAGTYCCTITSNVAPYCTDSDCYTIPIGTDTCITIYPAISNRTCNDVTVSVSYPMGAQYSWSLSTYANGSYCSPTQASNSTTAHFNVLGEHYVKVYAELNGQCYKGSRQVPVDCVPEIALSYDCNNHNIIVQDISQYRSGYSIPARTVTVDGESFTATIYSPQMSVSIPATTLSNGTYTINMSFGNTGCECSKDITIEHIPQISINIPANMCVNTPFQFSATPNNNHFQYYWDFGDFSYNTGNNIFHTYTANALSPGRTVTLIVKNQLGCTATLSQNVNVCSNVFGTQPSLSAQSSIPVCPGIPQTLQFNPHPHNSVYTWLPINPPYNYYEYEALNTGDYSVEAYYPTGGCRAKATCNVGFLTEPWARIIGNTEYCLGETVNLNGNTGANNTYTWTIAELPGFTSTGPTLSFTPSQPGTYTVTLTVSNQGNCSATATCTLTVNPRPAAPSIAFSGNHCIHTPPVEVSSTTGQSLFWSNGYHGTTAYSYSDGYLTAHYVDPSTGCRSYDAQIFIEPAPDFDALLTGCYRMCPEQFQYDLPIYGIYPYLSGYLNWDWIYQPLGSIYTVVDQDPLLPLIDFGSYYLDATYTAGCTVESPELFIDKDEICPCDSVSFKPHQPVCWVDGCKMHYSFNYTICNDGSQPLNFDDIRAIMGGHILSANPSPLYIAPGDCEDIDIEIAYTDFSSSSFEFIFIDHSRNCEVKYVENIDWQSCVEEGCEGVSDYSTEFFYEFSTSHESSYYQFHIPLPAAQSVLSVWSKPSQVIDFTGNGSYPVELDGLLMLDYGLLSQMFVNDQPICIYFIACIDGENLCYDSICIPPHILWEQIPDDLRQLVDPTMADNDSTRSLRVNMDVQQGDKPYLAPNPAHDEVTVMGIAPEEVAEITILTMQGGQVADSRNDYRFNVSRLAKATYIVRVVTTDRRVHYLKLVKQ